MTRILVQPEHLRTLAAQSRRQADDLRSILGNLSGALGGLDWQVRESAGIEGGWQSARGRGYSLAEQAEALARYLDRKAQAFDEADNAGAAQVGQVAGAFTVAQQQWSGWWQQRSAVFSFPQALVERLWKLGWSAVTAPITWVIGGLGGAISVVGGLLVGVRDLRTSPSAAPGQPAGVAQPVTPSPSAGAVVTGPPSPPALRAADPTQYTSCALYAQARRPDLGQTGGDGGAYNYIQNYRNSPRYYQVPPEATGSALQRTSLRTGTVVIWDRGQQSANATWGHVAIIEAVGADYIEVSEAGWGSGTRRRIPAADVPDLHFIL
jgi:surface antigen